MKKLLAITLIFSILFSIPIQAKALREGKDWIPIIQFEVMPNSFEEVLASDYVWNIGLTDIYIYDATYNGKYFCYISPIFNNETILPYIRRIIKNDPVIGKDSIRVRNAILDRTNTFSKEGSITTVHRIYADVKKLY